jgi:hypothetical protein
MYSSHQTSRRRPGLLLTLLFLLTFSTHAPAQTPFVTDDAETTPRGHFHLEFGNELDVLQRSAFPTLKQNAVIVELDYGLFHNVEVGVAMPWITLFNKAGSDPRRVAGIGDTNVSLKYNFLKERENSRRPAVAISLNLELPTGSVRRQLGSGLTDVYLNGILQKSVSTRTRFRLNGGILFSGNETTGVVGIKSRGTVFTGGSSLVKEFTPRLQLGLEFAGALTKTFQLDKGQLQAAVGGNYLLRDNLSLDFAIVGGKYAASPRLGAKLGFSIDF